VPATSTDTDYLAIINKVRKKYFTSNSVSIIIISLLHKKKMFLHPAPKKGSWGHALHFRIQK